MIPPLDHTCTQYMYVQYTVLSHMLDIQGTTCIARNQWAKEMQSKVEHIIYIALQHVHVHIN